MNKNFIKRSFSILLLITALLCFAAPSWARPNWVSTNAKWSIVRNEKQNDPKANNYYYLKASVTYTNNSEDKIILSIFGKTLNATGTVYYWDKYNTGNTAGTLNSSIKSTKVNNMNLYPGQSTSLYYLFPFNGKLPYLSAFNTNRKNGRKSGVRDIKWSHDFKVSTKRISVE